MTPKYQFCINSRLCYLHDIVCIYIYKPKPSFVQEVRKQIIQIHNTLMSNELNNL